MPLKRRTKMRRRTRTKAEWEELVREYRESGVSLKEWCSEKGINYKTMCGNTYLVPQRSSKRGDQEWVELIKKQQMSGMSQSGWCKQHKINPSTMASAIERLKIKFGDDFLNKSLSIKTVNSTPTVENDNAKIAVSYPDVLVDTVIDAENNIPSNGLKWVKVDVDDSLELKNQQEVQTISNRNEAIKKQQTLSVDEIPMGKETHTHPQIIIKCGKLIIEADATYPSEHLETLIGRLIAAC